MFDSSLSWELVDIFSATVEVMNKRSREFRIWSDDKKNSTLRGNS